MKEKQTENTELNGKKYRIKISHMPENKITEAADLILNVWKELPEKDWFVADDRTYLEDLYRKKKGWIYQAEDVEKGITAGIFSVYFPHLSEENLGNDMGFSDEQKKKTVHMDAAAVRDEYRGLGLQRRLMQAAEQELKTLGYEYLFSTVHPENHYSLDNLKKQGYQIVKTCKKYGGKLRHIMLKEI